MFQCWNSRCPNYAGYGMVIREKDLIRNADGLRCARCGSPVREAGHPTESKPRTLAGGAGGALLGWAIGGPAGAVLGGIIGLLLGAAADEKELGS